jgi:nicotinamide mononucleotide adenylyltransferase
MHSELTTDLSIIKSNLDQLKSDKENVVLIKTGALNPIHRSHISNMIKTKLYLENIYHFNVIGGFLSPTHDRYVESKLEDEFIPSNLRIQMCEKAIEEENQQHWLSVDKAEAMGIHFILNYQIFIHLF